MEFDKRSEIFPVKDKFVWLESCGVSAACAPSRDAVTSFTEAHSELGSLVFTAMPGLAGRFHASFATLMKTSPENISYVRNSAEALSIVANGYPIQPGDEILSYAHEYPSNHYCWNRQVKRGAVLKLIPDSDVSSNGADAGRPRGFSLEDVERLITPRTRIVAVSQVQFTSGFAVDVGALGEICKKHGIDLVVDVAQSLGALPFYPDQMNCAAAAGSGWKWLFGPIGSGFLYTRPDLRQKVEPTLVGPDMMRQDPDYLNLAYDPKADGKKFEYSTNSYPLLAGLEASVGKVLLKYPAEAIRAEIFRLQDVFLGEIDQAKYKPVLFREENRSGLLALVPRDKPPADIVKAALAEKIKVSTRGGYLRVAPQFWVDDDEMRRAAKVLNEI